MTNKQTTMETDSDTIITDDLQADKDYCGLVCGFLLADQQEILDRCIEHAKYDPEFAPVMIDKLIAKCMEAKALVLRSTTSSTTTKVP